MRSRRSALFCLSALLSGFFLRSFAADPRTPPEIIAAAPAAEWRQVLPENLAFLDLPTGRVIIELNPLFAPKLVERIRHLIRTGFFTPSAVVRVQENYVVQWNQPYKAKIPESLEALPNEFTRPNSAQLPFTALPDPDTYAPEAGFIEGFPVGRDPATGEAWLIHRYGMVGVGRGNNPDTGDGTNLYAVIGQAPRALDRNIAVVGRILQGMDLLSTLPRGKGNLGFYKEASEHAPITRMVLAADLPPAEQMKVEVLRTDSGSFRELIAVTRHKTGWFTYPVDRLDVVTISAPVRINPATP